mmetsp:Transcript_20688/g.41974  ORF Transcript_20688/g.41974 Transcript_20688/m.41974 type:complete len:127 (+) Transcript_20688:21-401(+)
MLGSQVRWGVLLTLCVLPELCSSFSLMLASPNSRIVTVRRSVLCPKPMRLVGLKMDTGSGGQGGNDSEAKDALLKKLASTDEPKGPPPKEVKKTPLPEWFYFALPFFGAATAFAIQYFTKNPLPIG